MINKRPISIDGFSKIGSKPKALSRPVNLAKTVKSAKPVVTAVVKQLPPQPKPTKTVKRPVVKTSTVLSSTATKPVARHQPFSQELDFPSVAIEDLVDKKTEKTARQKKKSNKLMRWISRVVVILLLGGLVYGGFYVYKILSTSSQVLEGDWTGLLAPAKPLKTDANGRTNVLIFGTAEDDECGNHGGANLTDSIMVVSVDKENNDMAMLNLPRDLWVKLEKPCVVGYQEKINTVYSCASNDGQDEKAGAEALMRKVGEITGLELHYYAHINFGGVVALVDAVDGVDVEVMGSGPVPYGVKPGSILDRNFDWKCGGKCFYVKYEPGIHHMDGEHALAFIRARNANGGYGLPNSNFDREKNQQKVINALTSKMLNAGTLANLDKFNKILDAVGKNLRTNIASDEVRSIIELAKGISFSNGRSISLVAEGKAVVGTGTSIKGTSIVQPRAGMFDYSGIKKYISQELIDNGLSAESAKIGVYNASGEAGAAGRLADSLKEAGLDVVEVGNASSKGCTGQGKAIFSLSDDKPKTLAKIKKLTGGKPVAGDCQPDFSYNKTSDFLIVITGE